jgi:hypothetical protein
VAFGTFGFVAAEDQSFEFVIALLAYILENRHEPLLGVISI